MANTLTVNGIEITLTATELPGNTQYKLTGTYDPKSTGKNFNFQKLDDPNNPNKNDYSGKSFKIISDSKSSSPITIKPNGKVGEKIWVWSDSDTMGTIEDNGLMVQVQDPTQEN
ncbi:hypothetical protein [Tenacibaculum amylolyticum]|uniref:hypothetical protein n=1 Tax=Tenacibaculum amylolyticum TaxID=104269 RepID=UPI003895F063